MNIANKARRLLIRFGKVLPFILCAIVCLQYLESIYALWQNNYKYFIDYTILNTPISFYIANVFEYDILVVIVTFIISAATETCIYNKISVLYLALQLWLKSYLDFELEPTTIYIISITNVAISGYLTFKGIQRI